MERRFGDEHSSLLDEFERMWFETQAAELKRVMLGRSLSEARLPKSHTPLISMAPMPLVTQVMQGSRHHGGGGHRRGSGFHKVFKKLLKPILGRKKGASHAKDLMACKAFSTSLRF